MKLKSSVVKKALSVATALLAISFVFVDDVSTTEAESSQRKLSLPRLGA